MLQWLQYFLANRTQSGYLCQSSPYSVTSARSTSNIHKSNIHSQLRLFVNDYHPIHSAEHHRILLKDLDMLSSCTDTWLMKFNVQNIV